MKVLVDLDHLTDDEVEKMWAVHRALKFIQDNPGADLVGEDMVALEPETPAAAYTKEDVRKLMLEVNKKCGLKAPLGIVSKFGVSKVSELAEKDYPAVVQECRAALGN